MPMTVVVTRNVPGRFRGFLASAMCEISPGIYSSPRMTRAVRERVWTVMEEWFRPGSEESVVMTWREPDLPGGQAYLALGVPRKDLRDHHGVFLARRELQEEELRSLTTELGVEGEGEEGGAPEPA